MRAHGSSDPAAQPPGRFQDAIDGGRAHGDHVRIEHHEGQTTIAIEGVRLVEVEDGLPLRLGDPVIARDTPVVGVHGPIAIAPAVELHWRHSQPVEDPAHPQFGAHRIGVDEVHDRVPHIGRNPLPPQLSPSFFFRARYSSDTSAMTASFFASQLCVHARARPPAAQPRRVRPSDRAPARFSSAWRCHR